MMKRISSGFLVALMIVAAGLVANMLPLRAQYAQQSTFGGTSTCSSNAQTINLGAGNVASYSDLKGVTISWIVGTGCTDTGPSTLALTGVSGGPYNIYRRNGGALIQLGGYEMPAGDLVRATWDGTQFELETDYVGSTIVGISNIIHYATADPGFLLDDGACESETAYPALYAKLGTAYNTADGCTGSNFGLPDLRERTPIGLGTMGGASDPGRITSAVSGFDPTTLGAYGGAEGRVVAQANLANFDLVFPPTGVQGIGISNSGVGSAGTIEDWNGGSGSSAYVPETNVPTGGGNTPLPTLPPVQIVQYEIRT